MDDRYIKFYIPKKDGSKREILAPNKELKEKQREFLNKLYTSSIFNYIYPRSFGFLPNKNIVKNAKYHVGKKFLLKVDIKDFFPSCKYKYIVVKILSECSGVDIDEATELIYYKNGKNVDNWYLPQGAPTSPFISNLYLNEFDRVFVSIARNQFSDDIIYTRYADDLCISSNSKCIFSNKFLIFLKNLLKNYHFEINEEKIKKLSPGTKKKVTGIVVTSDQPTISRQERRKYKAWVHNIISGKCSYTKEDIYHILGKLAFFYQVPKHRNWIIMQRKLLLNCM